MNKTMKDLLEIIISSVFAAEESGFANEIEKILSENNKLLRSYNSSFTHLGKNYGLVFKRDSPPALAAPLVQRMNTLLRLQREVVDIDRQMARQGLTQVLKFCSILSEARQALPECVVELYPAMFADIPRTKEPAWMIAADQRAMHLYLKGLEKIEMYLAMKLLLP